MPDGNGSAEYVVERNRLIPVIAVAGTFIVFVLLYYTGRAYLARGLLQNWGVIPFRMPFLDAETVMSALRCVREGVDVFESNPCDPLGRVYDYSPLWLHAAIFPFATSWIVPVGLAVDCIFIAALAWLPAGRSWWQVGGILAAVMSPPVAFALERANNDLIIFTLATIAAVLSVRSLPWRLAGLACAFLAGLLKYYPMLLMALALRERLRLFIAITILSIAALALFVWAEYEPLVRALALIPIGSYFGDMFGARTLSFGIAEWAGLPPGLDSVGQLVCDLIAIGLALAMRERLGADLGRLPARTLSFLLAGALIVLACFHTAQNIGYRAILLVLVVPAFVTLAGEGERRRLWAFNSAVVIVLLWAEGWRHWLDVLLAHDPISSDTGWSSRALMQMGAWLLREGCWWWVVSVLWSILFTAGSRSRATVEAAALWARSLPASRSTARD